MGPDHRPLLPEAACCSSVVPAEARVAWLLRQHAARMVPQRQRKGASSRAAIKQPWGVCCPDADPLRPCPIPLRTHHISRDETFPLPVRWLSVQRTRHQPVPRSSRRRGGVGACVARVWSGGGADTFRDDNGEGERRHKRWRVVPLLGGGWLLARWRPGGSGRAAPGSTPDCLLPTGRPRGRK